jgi:predicted DNA-binding mobile mystery protein A
MKTNQLAAKQLDKQLEKWKRTKSWLQPKNNWVKTIRKILGMTTVQLANRLGVDRSRVIRIESDEVRTVLTMKTLIAVANALDCDFVYAFVPRKPLQEMIEQQAHKIAALQINSISHNMFLENQALSPKQNKEQVEDLKTKLLETSLKKLWDCK